MKHGKRLITGTSNGEILEWNTNNKFAFQQSNSVHSKKTVKAITLTNFEQFIVSGDKEGKIVYSDVKCAQKNHFQAHNKSSINDISFSNSSVKFVYCADDSTAKIFDFATSM